VTEPEIFATFTGVGFTLTPPVKAYLRRFVNWLRATGARPQPAAAPADNGGRPEPETVPGGGGVGRCAACGEEYLFETEAVWEAEHGDPCSKCGGPLVRAARVVP
jgi:hypothetical protein